MFITLDNQDLKSTAGTPLNLPPYTLSGLTVQRTAILFTTTINLCNKQGGGLLNRGLILRNSRLEPLGDNKEIEVNSPSINILQNSVLNAKERVAFETSEFRMSQSTIKFGGNLDLYCSGSVNLDGSIVEEYTSSE